MKNEEKQLFFESFYEDETFLQSYASNLNKKEKIYFIYVLNSIIETGITAAEHFPKRNKQKIIDNYINGKNGLKKLVLDLKQNYLKLKKKRKKD